MAIPSNLDPAKIVTARQLELLGLYASGFTQEEISNAKFLSLSAVKQSMLTARDRVGARSLTHLCVILVDRGILVHSEGIYKPIVDDRIVD